jgi:nucleoside-diphosphate-sugar epimerase
MKEKILVTGGAGFIGHHLVRFLKEKGYEVRSVDMESDLRNFDNALKATEGIDWVFNLAALNGSIEYTVNNHAELIHNNTLVNLNMAEACYRNKVKRVLYTSSACVYPLNLQDTDNVNSLKEESAYPANCDTEYGWEKLFSEHIWKSYEQDRGLKVRISRFFNIYGPECPCDTLMAKAPMALTKKVIDAGNSGDVYIWGDGNQKREFCYVDDCVEALWILMNSDVNTPVNIGTDNLLTINELVDLISDIEGVKVNKIHQLDRAQGVRVRKADCSKMHSLGWKPKVELREGLTILNKYIKNE